jgi:hypothetical protein
LEPEVKPNPFPKFEGNVVRIAIPLEVTGLSVQDLVSLKSFGFEMVTTTGLHFAEQTRRTGAKPNFTSLSGFITSTQGDSPTYHLIVFMERSLYDRVARLSLTLKGQFATEFHRSAARTALRIDARTGVPNFGQCAVSLVTARAYEDEMLRVACESPVSFPQTQVMLTDTNTGRHREELLGGALNTVSYPRATWLSPVNRREAFFHLTSIDDSRAVSQWRLPTTTLDHYRLEVEPQPLVGNVVVEYQLPGIDLKRYTAAER